MTLAFTITPEGAVQPDYPDILAELIAGVQGIFGSDVYLAPDSQDGQLLAIFAEAINDANNAGVQVYNSFSPATAVGTGLSSVVKINGLRRLVPSNSQVVLTLVGQVGTEITSGIVGDNLNLGTQWALPPTVIIPNSGTLNVTAVCTVPGAVNVPPASLTKILTPTANWQSVNNAAAAVPGNPVESDATLRQRQSTSTSLPALTPVDAIYAQIANLTGVDRLMIYENDTNTVDGDGVPPHSISAVVEGGAVIDIATAIADTKTPGCGTYGTTTQVVYDQYGIPNTINFFALALIELDVVVTIHPLPGFVSTTEALIQEAVAAFLSGLTIGEDSYCFRLGSPAQLSGDAATGATGLTQQQLDALANTYVVTSITQALHGNPPLVQDLAIAFNQAAYCLVADVTVNLV